VLALEVFMRPWIADPPPELMARGRWMYDHTRASLREIAAVMQMSVSTFQRRRIQWGWPERKSVSGRRVPDPEELARLATPPQPPVPAGQGDALDPARQSLRLERLVARRIDGLEAEAALGQDRDPERTDRRLVQLDRLLAGLRKRRGALDDNDETPPARSVAELRDELLRHLERLRRAARSRKLPPESPAA
jgi:hypothetical protein